MPKYEKWSVVVDIDQRANFRGETMAQPEPVSGCIVLCGRLIKRVTHMLSFRALPYRRLAS
jgi:hypothetical protein